MIDKLLEEIGNIPVMCNDGDSRPLREAADFKFNPLVEAIDELKGRVERKIIYLASPYSDPDPEVQRKRYDAALACTAKLFSLGEIVISPIIHQRPIANALEIGHDYKTHCEFNIAMIQKCKRFMVLKLPGWENSVGVKAEIEFAKTIGREIHYLNPEDFIEDNY